jgi:hypothetical protein
MPIGEEPNTAQMVAGHDAVDAGGAIYQCTHLSFGELKRNVVQMYLTPVWLSHCAIEKTNLVNHFPIVVLPVKESLW